MDALVAERADFLRRWFELGIAMSPAELRRRVEAEEEAAALDGPGRRRRALVLHLPRDKPQGSDDNRPALRVGPGSQ